MNKNFFNSISIIGKPNSGKSTLFNIILKKEISIVTNKPQTTRNIINSILDINNNLKIILNDTPGIDFLKNNIYKFNKLINNISFSIIKKSDFILFLIPINEEINYIDIIIFNLLKKLNKKFFLIFTKIDLFNNDIIYQKLNNLKNKIFNDFKFNFFDKKNIFLISSLKYLNIDNLINKIENISNKFKKNIFSINNDFIFNKKNNFYIKEIIRKQIYLSVHKEIPYCTGIIINKLLEKKNLLKIWASIYVEKQSQKIIIIGKNGEIIKKIGINSRIELEKINNKKIYLNLFVKVFEKWRNNEFIINKILY